MEHNGATVFKSTWLEFVLSILSVDTRSRTSPANLRYTRSKVQRKLNFREQERETEREKGRKARSACNLRLVGRDAGERVALVSRSFLNSGREERGATRSRGRGRLLATTRPFARRLGPPLLASCRPTTASVCFRALVCASSGATVALLLYRPIRTFVLAPSLSLALEPTTWRPFGTASGGVRLLRYARAGILLRPGPLSRDRARFLRDAGAIFRHRGKDEMDGRSPRICSKGFFQWKWNVRDLEVSRIEFDRKRSSRISWKNSLGIFHFWISLIIVISIGIFTAKVFIWNENWLEILKFLLLTHAYNVRIFTVVSHVITFYTRMIRLLLLYHTFFIPV